MADVNWLMFLKKTDFDFFPTLLYYLKIVVYPITAKDIIKDKNPMKIFLNKNNEKNLERTFFVFSGKLVSFGG